MGDTPWKKFERTCAEWFSRWLCGAVDKKNSTVAEERIICRQSLMGRMVERIWGDMAIHPKIDPAFRPAAEWFMGKFMVDAKLRKRFRLTSLLTSPHHEFWQWWDKLTDDASRAGGKYRLMVLMEAGSKGHILAFGNHERQWFLDQFGGFKFPSMGMWMRQDAEKLEEISFCEFEEFLKWADPVGLGCPEVKRDAVTQ